MNDGDQCPECECGTMFVLTASLDILRCSWCGHREALDTVERPKRKDLKPSQKRL